MDEATFMFFVVMVVLAYSIGFFFGVCHEEHASNKDKEDDGKHKKHEKKSKKKHNHKK